MREKARLFFWFCSGINVDKLQKTQNDWNKFEAIGATVFFTACIAMASSSFAFF